MEETYKKYKDQGLRVVAISVEDPETLRAFAERKGLTFSFLSDPTGQVTQLYQAESIPTNFFVNRQGQVVDATVGFDPDDGPAHIDQVARKLVEETGKISSVGKRAGDSEI